MAGILDRLLELEKSLHEQQRLDPLKLMAPNAALLAVIVIAVAWSLLTSSPLLSGMNAPSLLLGVMIIAAAFGFYGVATVQASRRRILQLEALRLQRRAMLAAHAMEPSGESRET